MEMKVRQRKGKKKVSDVKASCRGAQAEERSSSSSGRWRAMFSALPAQPLTSAGVSASSAAIASSTNARSPANCIAPITCPVAAPRTRKAWDGNIAPNVARMGQSLGQGKRRATEGVHHHACELRDEVHA